MFWGMMDIGPSDADRDTRMAEGCDSAEPFTTDPNEPEKQVWRPDWSKAVNTSRNTLFIREVVTRVYDNETVSIAIVEWCLTHTNKIIRKRDKSVMESSPMCRMIKL